MSARGLTITLAVLVVGCHGSFDPDAKAYRCLADDECLLGYVCSPTAGICVASGGGTGGTDTGAADPGRVADFGGAADTGAPPDDEGAVDPGGDDAAVTADDGGPPRDVDDERSTLCDDYCSLVQANCTGEDQQYESGAACLGYCIDGGRIPAGTREDRDGNSIGCRLYHARVAGDDPAGGSGAIHCPHAGPSGGDFCGSWCDNYCHLALTNCTGDQALFSGQTACLDACGEYETDGKPGDTSGDTVQCRLEALGRAGGDRDGGSAAQHCPSGGVTGGGVCGPTDPNCDVYCSLIVDNCAEQEAQYDDYDDCVDYCGTTAQIPAGTFDDHGGNTLGCRIYHAMVAANDPAGGSAALHCPHAGPTGADFCGTWCDNYCHLAMLNCSGASTIYANLSDCQQACSGFPTSGRPGDTSGDTVQCRISFAAAAGENRSGVAATLSCPSAGPSSTDCR